MISETPTRWGCPSCDARALTRTATVPMRPCCGQHGFMVPLAPDVERAPAELLGDEPEPVGSVLDDTTSPSWDG